MKNNTSHPQLKRELGWFSATLMGLGSIIGTGVFVSIGVAAGVTGYSVILAIALAALVATCNALSSAQLAASHAVSGGTYEYGYRYLHPCLGFTAGWMFLCAKTASAATAALGFSGYLLSLLNIHFVPILPIAIGTIVILTLLVVNGIKKSSLANTIIVSITLASLIALVIFGWASAFDQNTLTLQSFFPAMNQHELKNFFYATAFMFVAYTGYGRIATLAEEVKNPKRFIPRAIGLTLIISAILYIAVGIIAVGTVGTEQLAHITQSQATPLETVARTLKISGLDRVIAIGACTAMLGVLLNLILGLSRVVLAMGRQGDLPRVFGLVSQRKQTPSAAVIGVGIAIIGFTLTGSVEITWAFSAFTVLIYYAITNLAALRLPKSDRLYPRFFAMGGLISCLFLCIWVPPMVWLLGLGFILAGFVWHGFIARYFWH